MLIRKRDPGGRLQQSFSETMHEKQTQELRAYLQSKGYDPNEIIREEGTEGDNPGQKK